MSEFALPPIREELTLFSGPKADDGAPTWTIHDPLSNRFFFISWLEFEILSNWQQGTPEALIETVNSQTTLNITQSHLESMVSFLASNSLLVAKGNDAIKRFSFISKKLKKRDIWWFLKNYLFLRVPLVNPDLFLTKTYKYVRWVYSTGAQCILLLVFLAGMYLVSRQWDAFLHTFVGSLSLDGMIWYLAAIGFCKVIHELGHAYTAHRYGCRVSSMGVMFLVMMPVLFTDTTESWKLDKHKKRLKIAASGMMTEMGLASIALLLWSLLPDCPARSASFMIATSAWLITLAINLNPFMKFDGYYIASDWLQMPNLQDRSFALGKWWLREQLFGFGQAPPERLSRKRQNGMIIYAFCVWVYRFFLFVGIAFLVYSLFFKILGIFLFFIEIVYFVAMPIFKEVKVWWQKRTAMHLNRQTLATLGLFIVGITLFVVPWKTTLLLPATIQPKQKTELFSQVSGKIEAINVAPGQFVQKDQVLFVLSSINIDYQILREKQNIRRLVWQLDNLGLNEDLRKRTLTLKSELEESESKLAALNEERSHLIVKAPFAGKVVELSETLQRGQTISEDEPLLFMVSEVGSFVEAFVGEADIRLIDEGMEAVFYPETPEQPLLRGYIAGIDNAATRILTDYYLASPFGGEIAAQVEKSGEVIPSSAVYRLRLELAGQSKLISWISRGRVRVEVKPESFAEKARRRISALLIRESGF